MSKSKIANEEKRSQHTKNMEQFTNFKVQGAGGGAALIAKCEHLTNLHEYSPPAWALAEREPPPPAPPLDATPLTHVDTLPQLMALLAHLRLAPVIAVDLEHHTYHAGHGITCLIQITTEAGGDFIVDALALRDHLHRLNETFTDPNKVKVFHGADNDVKWLKRDFNVYLVGLFDTHQAARLLALGVHSLQYLLSRYCAVNIDKKYQMADWRIRPLPAELVRYARSDTHYLLTVWRLMAAELRARSPALLLAAFQKSGHVAATACQTPAVAEPPPRAPHSQRGGSPFVCLNNDHLHSNLAFHEHPEQPGASTASLAPPPRFAQRAAFDFNRALVRSYQSARHACGVFPPERLVLFRSPRSPRPAFAPLPPLHPSRLPPPRAAHMPPPCYARLPPPCPHPAPHQFDLSVKLVLVSQLNAEAAEFEPRSERRPRRAPPQAADMKALEEMQVKNTALGHNDAAGGAFMAALQRATVAAGSPATLAAGSPVTAAADRPASVPVHIYKKLAESEASLPAQASESSPAQPQGANERDGRRSRWGARHATRDGGETSATSRHATAEPKGGGPADPRPLYYRRAEYTASHNTEDDRHLHKRPKKT